MIEADDGKMAVGRPPKKQQDKYGKPKQVTFTDVQWDQVNDHLEAAETGWMDFARAAIMEKIERDQND